MGTISAICISEQKGTPKTKVHEGKLIADFGLENDAHAGNWHRQVSLLPHEAIEQFKSLNPTYGSTIPDGAFGENLIVSGIDFSHLTIGSRLACANAVLEITQFGKECHSHCAIHQVMGDCIMPRQGIFARVLRGGAVREGDFITELTAAAVITVSDSGFAGKREDTAGAAAVKILEENGFYAAQTRLVPDESEVIKETLKELCNTPPIRLILTTGGTGFSVRDVTPEATIAVCERLVPGIPEAIRAASLAITKRSMLSRAAAGIRGETLIINLSGSQKAVEEQLSFVIDTIKHGIGILTGSEGECAR